MRVGKRRASARLRSVGVTQPWIQTSASGACTSIAVKRAAPASGTEAPWLTQSSFRTWRDIAQAMKTSIGTPSISGSALLGMRGLLPAVHVLVEVAVEVGAERGGHVDIG